MDVPMENFEILKFDLVKFWFYQKKVLFLYSYLFHFK